MCAGGRGDEAGLQQPGVDVRAAFAGGEAEVGEERVEEAEEEHTAAMTAIEARDDELAALVPGRRDVPTLAEVQAQLDEQTTLISYWVLEDDDTLAFILTSDELNVVALGVGSEELSKHIDAF